MKRGIVTFVLVAAALAARSPAVAQETLGAVARVSQPERSVLLTTASGQRLRITPYGDYIVRIQAVRAREEFFPDDRYEMVASHLWPGGLSIRDVGSRIELESNAGDGIALRVEKNPLRLTFAQKEGAATLLQDAHGFVWMGDSVSVSFRPDGAEHFIGLGHDFYGRTEKLDLRGERISRNYGTMHRQQAPLIVPFFLSSKGYGLFLNSMFPNTFSFGRDGKYEISIAGAGRMDYFIILGPAFPHILFRYVQLTGSPRFPPKAAFGLALSDKGNDHTNPDSSDEKWWKRAVQEHRGAGFPIDHLVNDNRWRAGGGRRCESFFEWDPSHFPDPAEYASWIRANGLFATLDFNRCIARHSAGWEPRFNIPAPTGIDFAESAPDLTNPEVRKWFWGLFWKKSLDPDLRFPGDALWIDEFDEMGGASPSMVLANGRTWGEMRNYWFFLVAKGLVEEGWDRSFHSAKRPFVWVRGMTAGAQRYATLWSGDIRPTYEEMKLQVRGLQAAGISGFPFWGHDAGGFYDYEKKSGPDETMYRQWSMAFGSFTPFWKPHGPGQSRWPLQRSRESQVDARKYARLRYELFPYLYTIAHEASAAGIPMARPMVVAYQDRPEAWVHDLQYLWGDALLVAPNCSDNPTVRVWLPPGEWYNFWTDSLFPGDRVVTADAPIGQMPIFVRAGSIIPMAPFALGTASIPDDSLTLHIYPGADGSFTLYEDDGCTQEYLRGRYRTTRMEFTHSRMELSIAAADRTYEHAPEQRAITLAIHRAGRGVLTFPLGRRNVTEPVVIPLPLPEEGR